MIFRRSRRNHQERLGALGRLLDQRGFERDGLCILAVGDGYEVSGLCVPERGAAYDLAHDAVSISPEELEAMIARLRGRG